MEVESSLDRLLVRAEAARRGKKAVSIAYLGNIVDLWERLAKEGVAIDLGSDQTSLHNPYGGGYYPAGISFDEAQLLMRDDPAAFKSRVQDSLRRQVDAINVLAAAGMRFWDYGNAFLLEAGRAGAAVTRPDGSFVYPSYVEDIMGPMCFDFGFGPFRWVCASGDHADLAASDAIAGDILEEMAAGAPELIRRQIEDNALWIRKAEANRLVVGSQARILYADGDGRLRIALAFNAAIRDGRILGPIVLGRDHHDVSGTDSPYRETANIRDGSNLTADMAVHNVIGDAFRGATWVSVHNGGGVGWGEAINGGFGMVIDGSADAERRVRSMIAWDVNNGIARRAWARNEGAEFAIRRAMAADARMRVTMPEHADDAIVDDALRQE
jgi:urocanate hydratase